MFCPNCGAQLPDGSRFCINCGAQLQAGAAPAQRPQQPQQQAYGGAYPPQQPQHAPHSHLQPQQPKKGRKTGLIIALITAALLLLGAGVAAIVIWGHGNDPQPNDPGSNMVDGPGSVNPNGPAATSTKTIYLPVSATEETVRKDSSGSVQYSSRNDFALQRDANLNVVRWTSTNPEFSGGETKEYTYNADGTVAKYATLVNYSGGSDRIERTFQYEADGRTSRADTTFHPGTAESYTSSAYYSYDENGLLQVISTYYNGAAWINQQVFNYDAQGRLISAGDIDDPGPSMFWKYDSQGMIGYSGPNGKSTDEIEVVLTRGSDGTITGSKGDVSYIGDSDSFSTVYGAMGADKTSTATASSTGYYRNGKATVNYDDHGNIVEYSIVHNTADGGSFTTHCTIEYKAYEVAGDLQVSKQLVYLVAEPSYDVQIYEMHIYDPCWQYAGTVELPYDYDPHLPYYDNEFAG